MDKAAPAGKGGSRAVGVYPDAKGQCVFLTSKEPAAFDIVAASGGATPSPTASVSPTASPTPVPVPQGGELAATGSSSPASTLGLIGGVAVVAGAGVVFAVRRRRSDDSA